MPKSVLRTNKRLCSERGLSQRNSLQEWLVTYSLFLVFVLREALLAAIQQVSSEEPSSEEVQSDTQGSTSSLGVPGTGPKRAETFSGFDSKLKPDNINRASSMRAPERPGVGFPSRQLPGTVSPVVGSPKVKHKRRPSGGGWPFLTKSNIKEDKEQGGSTGTGRDAHGKEVGGRDLRFSFDKSPCTISARKS